MKRVYASALELAAAVFNRPDHVPKRTCLGCGGGTYRLADGRDVWIDCEPRGASVYGLVEVAPLDVRRDRPVSFTWRQIAAAIPQDGALSLPFPYTDMTPTP